MLIGPKVVFQAMSKCAFDMNELRQLVSNASCPLNRWATHSGCKIWILWWGSLMTTFRGFLVGNSCWNIFVFTWVCLQVCESTGLHNLKGFGINADFQYCCGGWPVAFKDRSQTTITRNMNFDSFEAHDTVLNRALDNLLEVMPEQQKLAKYYWKNNCIEST